MDFMTVINSNNAIGLLASSYMIITDVCADIQRGTTIQTKFLFTFNLSFLNSSSFYYACHVFVYTSMANFM